MTLLTWLGILLCLTQSALLSGLNLAFFSLPECPDLVFPRLRKVILVHGCFWHQRPGCSLARAPKSRPDYWLPKLRRNQERDAEAAEALKRLGWDCPRPHRRSPGPAPRRPPPLALAPPLDPSPPPPDPRPPPEGYPFTAPCAQAEARLRLAWWLWAGKSAQQDRRTCAGYWLRTITRDHTI
jgi:DNA mismatch endonuclease Vsr